MKLFLVVPVNLVYNDEYHYPEGYAKPTMLFREKEKAQAVADQLSGKAMREERYEFERGEQLPVLFEIIELEIEGDHGQ